MAESKFGGKPIDSKFGGKPLLTSTLSGMPEGSRLEEAQNQKPVVDFGTFVMATPAFRFIEGAADLPLGAAQAVSEGTFRSDKVTKFLKQREERIQRGREAVGSEGFDIPRTLGNVSTAMAATSGVGVAPTVTGKMAQGAAIGAVAGASTPATETENFIDEQAGQIKTGAAVGGIVPGVLELGRSVVRAGRNLITPLLPKGVDNTVRNVVTETTENVDDTVSALRNARPGENVGQATSRTGNAPLAAFQQAGDKANSSAAARQQSAQNASRLQRLRQVGGAVDDQSLDDAIDTARQVRTQRTNPLYEAAKKSEAQVDASRTQRLLGSIKEADPRNQKLISALDNVEQSIKDTSSPRELVSAWRNIGNLIDEKGPTGQRVNENIVRQLTTLKRSLESDIGRSVPEFRQANQLFKELSQPVNRAEVARELERRLTSSLSGSDDSVINQQASNFNSALQGERKLVSQATGFNRGKLDKFFNEDEINTLKGISQELQNNAEFNRLAQLGRSEARQILGTLGPEPVANPLNRVIMIANAIIRKSGSVQQGAVVKRIGEIFQDPNKLADLLEEATERERGLLRSALSEIPTDQLARTAPAVTVNQ